MNTTPPTHLTNKSVLTAAYYLSFIMLGMLTAAEGSALPGLAQNTSSTLDQISLIFIFGSLGYLLGSLFGGQVYDRLSSQHVISTTLFLISLCMGMVPFIHSLSLLLVDLFLLGLAKGTLDVGCNILLLWVHGETAGPFMNALHFFFGLGATCAPLILAGVLHLSGGIQWMFWLFALLSLPLAVWLWTLPGPFNRNGSQIDRHAPLHVIPVVLIVLAFLLYVGAEIGFGNWIYTYGLSLELGTSITSAYLTSAFWGTFTLGRLLGIWIAARAHAAAILFVDFAGCLVSLGLILLWQDSALILWGGTIGLGLFMASIFPTMLLLAGERIRISGAITGWLLAGASIGGMFLPWGIGQAFVRVGAVAMPVMVFTALTVNFVIIALFVNRPGSLPETS